LATTVVTSVSCLRSYVTGLGRLRDFASLDSFFAAIFSVLLVLPWSHVSAGPPTKKRNIDLAFVLLQKPSLPAGGDIVKAFADFAVEGQRLEFRQSTTRSDQKEDLLEFNVGPCGTAFVALVPFPVPKGEADDAARFSVSALGTKWKPPPHSAHLLVTLSGSDSSRRQTNVSCFTSLLAAVSKASGAVGIYWGNAGATHDPAFFASVAKEVGAGSRMMLWTGVSVARESDGRLSLLSLGMEQLDLPDLLLIAPRSMNGTEALGSFFDFLSYVAERGTPIPEGETVGRTADERLRVHYVPSPSDGSKQVWRVEFK
jgi:hypothetical protein